MAIIEVKCPSCGEAKVNKHGKTETGTQRYQCKNKDYPRDTFLLDYTNKGFEPDIDEQIIKMAVNASGIGDTARALGVSTQKMLDTLKRRRHR